ncbi:putative serine/threonine-protein kinase MPS1-like protein [Colletotrichum orbiculare MAFF 240422]|uniref:Serine/threonine-protein kinase MPS1-like protein n=1 Tax=Colletotrichum orbiculare (strain 104-T / ATCC 96160 / CBS 514.97 / LARS 414 / MAFF 240422) TaxID=1213857 RepID=A0A484FQA2_COLOR|nr:putative serine/threonine-protein kinase MPS1-like protein [Colletotrichum orbiculare MAFF 240422]
MHHHWHVGTTCHGTTHSILSCIGYNLWLSGRSIPAESWDLSRFIGEQCAATMAQIHELPLAFQRAYDISGDFPRNYVRRGFSTYPSALAEFARRLDDAADDLCESDINRVDVGFRDLSVDDGTGKELSKRNIHSPGGLVKWLEIHRTEASGGEVTYGVTSKDPKCRFIYIYGHHSRARLNITRSMLTEILTFHQVMPDYLDFLLAFGLQSDPRDLSFSSFREQTWLKPAFAQHGIKSLGPTNKGYHHRLYTAADIQSLLKWQEKICEVITTLESNVEVMTSLMRFYIALESHKYFDLRLSCADDIDEFANKLSRMIDDFKLQINRTRALEKLTTDRGELVKHHRLERLNQNMEREAMLVRIVTFVTLIYLPATFVSTFFSTDIIKYQDSESPNGNFSMVAMERWLQVTLPLTTITLGLAYAGKCPIRQEFDQLLQDPKVRRLNYEGKTFFVPSRIVEWMHRTPDGSTSSNGIRLFEAIYSEELAVTNRFPPNSYAEKSPLLFALLSAIGCGHMVHVFRVYIDDDSFLGISNLSNEYRKIVNSLTQNECRLIQKHGYHRFGDVIDRFDQERWAFYPALNVLSMEKVRVEEKSILPFFYSKHINKGGTAAVRHIKVQADLVDSTELMLALSLSKIDDPQSGMCYEFAVKSYFEHYDDVYRMESEAFRGFNGSRSSKSKPLGVVKYLGEWTRHDSSGSDTYHIMLEYGDLDLDEFLAGIYPPVLNQEIISFWESMFGVAKTLASIHQLQHEWEKKSEEYIGWHGDVKPDNILRVRGQFKLADFGFTKFEKREIGKTPTTTLLGGTRTYGAPERDQSQPHNSTLSYSTTIDTWSLGCVFSAVATWVILGSRAYQDYGKRRKMAICELLSKKKDNTGISLPNNRDAFHDGTEVLLAVTEWHDYLRNSMRRADTISHRVLDLVEEGMLVQDPSKRLELWAENRGPWTALTGKVPRDPFLAQFISHRDIIFVVDNAATMKTHWYNVKITLLALAMKIGPLDEDGLDLVYTLGNAHNVNGAKAWKIPHKFEKSLEDTLADIDPGNNTDMATTLAKLFDGYTNYGKKQTLIVLTDGLWGGSDKTNDVENVIKDFVKKLKKNLKKAESRWFSIQFISFGDDERALKRLEGLDDHLDTEEDIVDAKRWNSGSLRQLILGSMTQWADGPDTSGSVTDPPLPSRSQTGPKRASSFFSKIRGKRK